MADDIGGSSDVQKELAEDSKTLLGAAMSHHIDPVHLKGGEALDRKDKVVLIFNKDGKITGATTLRGVRDAAARVAAIQTTMQDGVRPDVILCADCGTPRAVVAKAHVPKRCAPCAKESLRKKNRDAQAAKRAADPLAARDECARRRAARSSEARAKEAKHDSDRARKRREENPDAVRARERNKRAKNPESVRVSRRKFAARRKSERETEKAKTATNKDPQ